MIKYIYGILIFVNIMTIIKVSQFNSSCRSTAPAGGIATSSATQQTTLVAKRAIASLPPKTLVPQKPDQPRVIQPLSPVKQTAAVFEQQAAKVAALPLHVKIAPPQPTAAPPSIFSKQGPLVPFGDKLQKLDLDDPQLKDKVQELKADVEKLKTKGMITEKDARIISSALDSLHTPGLYRASVFETTLLNQISKKLPSLASAVKQFPQAEKQVEREARSRVVKLLKANKENLHSLAVSLKQNPSQQHKVASARLKALNVKGADVVGSEENFVVENFSSLVTDFEKFVLDTTLPAFDQAEATFLKQFKQPEKLAALAKNYEYLNGQALLMKQSAQLYLSNKQYTKAEMQTYAQAAYHKMTAEYTWLDQNMGHQKTVYNQGADHDRNQGEGTCLQNSLDRQKMLLDTPAMATDKIVFGSSQQGRFAEAALSGSPKHQELSAKRAGLEKTAERPFEELQKTYLSSGKSMSCLVYLQNHGKTGHALNIQLDEKRKIFRFFDDNLGAFEYPSFEAFKSAFGKYLEAWYPELTTRSLAFFST